ncbi:MAG: hypothetical protein H6Q33_4630 [Deltaproteobacteria bacterium]|nr:hypothetical protein [Deltaproteobacteria bacterium]
MKPLLGDATENNLRASLKPEERLLLAVVESAYWDLRSEDPDRWQTARHYFLAEEEGNTFSFVSICQHFSWSPTSIRSQLRSFLETPPESLLIAAC